MNAEFLTEDGLKSLDLQTEWSEETTKVFLDISTYMNNGNIYVSIVSEEEGYLEPYADLTVNFDETLPSYHAYIDVNNLSTAEEFIRENGLGEPTGKVKLSGFCSYPLYKFNEDRLKEVCKKGIEAYENTLSEMFSIKKHIR